MILLFSLASTENVNFNVYYYVLNFNAHYFILLYQSVYVENIF